MRRCRRLPVAHGHRTHSHKDPNVIRYAFVVLAMAASSASAADRFVPPPAPRIVDAPPLALEREVYGNQQIIHIPRSSPARQFQLAGNYLVDLVCTGSFPLQAQLSTRTTPFGRPTEELVFLSLPASQDAQCQLTVLDRSEHPWKRMFQGTLASIPTMPN